MQMATVATRALRAVMLRVVLGPSAVTRAGSAASSHPAVLLPNTHLPMDNMWRRMACSRLRGIRVIKGVFVPEPAAVNGPQPMFDVKIRIKQILCRRRAYCSYGRQKEVQRSRQGTIYLPGTSYLAGTLCTSAVVEHQASHHELSRTSHHACGFSRRRFPSVCFKQENIIGYILPRPHPLQEGHIQDTSGMRMDRSSTEESAEWVCAVAVTLQSASSRSWSYSPIQPRICCRSTF